MYTKEQKDELVKAKTTADFERFKKKHGVISSLATLKRRAREYRQLGTEAPSLEERVMAERKRVQHHITEREQRQLLKRVAMVENVVESVKESVSVMPTIPKPRVPKKDTGRDEETAVLVLSDTHAGKQSKSYDSGVFTRRLERVATATERMVKLQRSDHPVNKLVIIMDGDMVDGEGIYPTQAFHVDQAVVNQMFQVAVPAFCEFLGQMAALFTEVEVHCVRGNHGRAGRFAEETSNWDIVLYRTLEIAMRDNPRVTFDITHDWKKFVDVMGTRFLVAHGHQIKSVLNIPWYGVTTKVMRWAGSLGHFDCLVIGHYHTRAYSDWNNQQFIMNGTFVTDDDFAEEVVGMTSSTMQTLVFVHPQWKITAYYAIELGFVT